MADNDLMARIHATMPRMNTAVCEGLARGHIAEADNYVDQVWRSAAEGYPKGVVYEGCVRCTPEEEYQYFISKRNKGHSYEHSRSTLYLVKFLISVNGVRIPEPKLFLPYVGEAGMITIAGSSFAISPVLVDKSLSIGHDSIFVLFNRDKCTFERFVHHIYVNGVRSPIYVVHGTIHHPQDKKPGVNPQKRRMKIKTVTFHYLLCKYGLREAFRRFAEVEVQVGYSEINSTTHPPEEWVLCRSDQIKPKYLDSKTYIAPDLTLAIPRSQWTLTTSSMVAAFFYLADYFPERVILEHLDEPTLWRVLLGHITFMTDDSEGKLLLSINAHFDSTDKYVDAMVREWFAADGIFVCDLYEFLYYIIDNFSRLVATSAESVASMYDKKLTVMRYVLRDIIEAIFNSAFDLDKLAKKADGAPLQEKDVYEIMKYHIRPHLISQINVGHAEVSSVSNPSACYVFKVTSKMIPQTRATSPSGGKSRGGNFDASKVLHASIAEVASANHQPKGEPTGRTCLNPYVHTKPDGAILRDPKKRILLESIQREIGR